MAVTNFQDFWITGSRFYFQKEDTDGLIDLGIIKVANPEIAPELVQLEDNDGGTRVIAEEGLTKIEEVYTIECNNLAPVNLAMLFLADLASFTQSASTKVVTHSASPGALLKIHDDDDDQTWLYGLTAIAGVYKAGTISTGVVVSINASTKTITVDTDLTAELDVGNKFIVSPSGLADVGNAKTYTVVSTSVVSGDTAVVVSETPSSTETGPLTGVFYYTGDTGPQTSVILDDEVDWDVISLDRGIIRLNESGAFTADGDVVVVFKTGAISGKRLINPQSLKGTIKGKGLLVWGRGNNDQQTMREFDCTITPAAAGLSDTDFSSISFRVRVTSDLTKATPAGRMIYAKGDLPSVDVTS